MLLLLNDENIHEFKETFNFPDIHCGNEKPETFTTFVTIFLDDENGKEKSEARK